MFFGLDVELSLKKSRFPTSHSLNSLGSVSFFEFFGKRLDKKSRNWPKQGKRPTVEMLHWPINPCPWAWAVFVAQTTESGRSCSTFIPASCAGTL